MIAVRTLILFARVVIEFFAWETIWGASAMLKMIYYGRFALMGVPLVSLLLLFHTIRAWSAIDQNGEERLVLQGEFKAVQERNREIHSDTKESLALVHTDIASVKSRLSEVESFHRRIEDKLDLGMRVLWSICGLLIVRVILPLMKLGLTREISRIAKGG